MCRLIIFISFIFISNNTVAQHFTEFQTLIHRDKDAAKNTGDMRVLVYLSKSLGDDLGLWTSALLVHKPINTNTFGQGVIGINTTIIKNTELGLGFGFESINEKGDVPWRASAYVYGSIEKWSWYFNPEYGTSQYWHIGFISYKVIPEKISIELFSQMYALHGIGVNINPFKDLSIKVRIGLNEEKNINALLSSRMYF